MPFILKVIVSLLFIVTMLALGIDIVLMLGYL